MASFLMVQARHMLFDKSNSTRKNNKVSNEKN